MKTLGRLLMRVVRFFDLHRAEGWRFVGLVLLYSTLTDALHINGLAHWIGIAGVVVLNGAQEAIEERKHPTP